jgi:DNA-directed RNA polymerase specialized sigma subunit
LFYGLDGEKMDYNYHSIAKILNITPQRVGQLYLSAIKRLKEKLNIEIEEDLNNDTSNRVN